MKILRGDKEVEIEVTATGVCGTDETGGCISYDFRFGHVYTSESSEKYYILYADIYPELTVQNPGANFPKPKCTVSCRLSKEQIIEILSCNNLLIDGLELRDGKLVTPVCYNHVYVEV